MHLFRILVFSTLLSYVFSIVFPSRCSTDLKRRTPESIHCTDYIPDHVIVPNADSLEYSVKMWNRGQYIPMPGKKCMKVSHLLTCSTNFFGAEHRAVTSRKSQILYNECVAAIEKSPLRDVTLAESGYICRWMEEVVTELTEIIVEDVPVEYDLLTGSYRASFLAPELCHPKYCYSRDHKLLWVPSTNMHPVCPELDVTVVTISPDAKHDFYWINSLALHSKTTKNSCVLTICGLVGLILSSGEWIQTSHLPPDVMQLQKHQIQNCSVASPFVGYLKSEWSETSLAVQIDYSRLYRSCERLKWSLVNEDKPSLIDLTSLLPKKVGKHSGFFLINSTLYSTECEFVEHVEHSGIKEGKDNTHSIVYKPDYKGPHFQRGAYIIGPSGLLWNSANFTDIEIPSLWHEIELLGNSSALLLNGTVIPKSEPVKLFPDQMYEFDAKSHLSKILNSSSNWISVHFISFSCLSTIVLVVCLLGYFYVRSSRINSTRTHPEGQGLSGQRKMYIMTQSGNVGEMAV